MDTNAWSRASNAVARALALVAMPLSAFAQGSYSPHVESHTTNVYWGDTHVHTALSSDAYIFGTRLTPDDAYRFAKGEQVRAANGEEVRLRRGLDFLMVADHAENMGVIARIAAGDETLLETEAGRRTALTTLQGDPLTEAYAFHGTNAKGSLRPCRLVHGRSAWLGRRRPRRTAKRSAGAGFGALRPIRAAPDNP